jgi:hypothetical protein
VNLNYRTKRLLYIALAVLGLLAVTSECGTETHNAVHCPPAFNIYRDVCSTDFQSVIHAKKTPFRTWNPYGWVYST